MRETNTRFNEAATELEQMGNEAEARFARLTSAQFDWRPEPGRWSIAQCLDHLVRTQVLYFPVLRELARGEYRPSTWARYSPFSALFGRMLVRALQPDNRNRTKTSRRAEPAEGDLGNAAVERFLAHQGELASLVRALPAEMDPRRVNVTSPLSRLVTYSLDDSLSVLVVHGRRHLAQAEHVTRAEGFPAG